MGDHHRRVSVVLAALLILAAGRATAQHAGAGPAEPGTASGRATESPSEWTGKVVETMTAGSYTYVQVDTGDEKIWAAAPLVQVKVGDTVSVPDGLPMRNYRSQSLNRSFDVVYFVGSIQVEGSKEATEAVHKEGPVQLPTKPPRDGATADPPPTEFSDIQRPEGGKTVEELFREKESLAGKEVVVRGKVVKFLPEIMDKNWIHLQDGTGSTGTNDLTVTTDASVKVGDTILVRGTVTTNRDFGFGYRYDLLIEDAKVTVE